RDGYLIVVVQVASELKSLSRISGPMLLTGLLLYSRSIISMLFLGRLGHLPLAAGSLSLAFANISAFSLLSGLALGTEPLASQAFGALQLPLLSLTLHRSILLLLTTSIPISILWLNSRPLLLFACKDVELADAAHQFLVFLIPTIVAHSLLHPLRVFLRAQGRTAPLARAALLAAAAHPAIAQVLLPRLGLRGVALAAALADFVLVFALLPEALKSPAWAPPPSARAALRCWRPLLSLALPTCASVCLEWWWYELMILLCGLLHNPKANLASMGILIQITSLVYIFPSGLSLGVSIRVGNELGANRPAKARAAMIVSLYLSLFLGLLAMAFAFLVRFKWATLFTADQEIISLTSMALPIVGLCELGNCPQTTGCGVLRGSARPVLGANINLGSFYFVGMPVALGLGFYFGLGLKGLWLGLLCAQACCAGLMMCALWNTDWEMEAEKARVLTGGAEQQPELQKKGGHESCLCKEDADSEPLLSTQC
ncbi:protein DETOXIFICATION 48, partial [Amborella trichopoda]